MNNSTAILVLGMPRSGTSAITRVLNIHGASLSENLLPASGPNPKGFFESAEALAIHERLLTAMGRTWYDISEMPEGWLERPETRQAKKELEELVRRDYLDKEIWVIKEPRMCRIVPLWLEVLEALNVSPRALLVSRHPEEVVSSVEMMVGEGLWSAEQSKILWLQYFFEAEKATRDIPRALITYDQLLRDWHFHLDRIALELKLIWPKSSADVKSEVDRYLGVEDRHHNHAPAETLSALDGYLPEAVYSTCNEMRGNYWGDLAKMYSDFSVAFNFFQRPMRDLLQRAVSHYVNIIATKQSELSELLVHHHTVFAEQKAELDELRLHHETVCSKQKAELDELRLHHDTVCSVQKAESDALWVHHHTVFAAQKAELDELRLHHNNVCSEQKIELDEIKLQLHNVSLSQQAELDKLVLLLGQANGEVSDAKHSMAELTSTVDRISSELRAAVAREERASNKLQELQEEHSALVARTGSRKWLIRQLFVASKKLINKP